LQAEQGLKIKGHDIAWMNQQASRLNPLQESPLSILDRKSELMPDFDESFLPIAPEMIQALQFTNASSVPDARLQGFHRKRKGNQSTR
jgi:hypothetical protein